MCDLSNLVCGHSLRIIPMLCFSKHYSSQIFKIQFDDKYEGIEIFESIQTITFLGIFL